MKTVVLDILTPDDEEMVFTILEGLRKGNAITFQALEPEQSASELHSKIQASLSSQRLSWEQGLQQLGL